MEVFRQQEVLLGAGVLRYVSESSYASYVSGIFALF